MALLATAAAINAPNVDLLSGLIGAVVGSILGSALGVGGASWLQRRQWTNDRKGAGRVLYYETARNAAGLALAAAGGSLLPIAHHAWDSQQVEVAHLVTPGDLKIIAAPYAFIDLWQGTINALASRGGPPTPADLDLARQLAAAFSKGRAAIGPYVWTARELGEME